MIVETSFQYCLIGIQMPQFFLLLSSYMLQLDCHLRNRMQHHFPITEDFLCQNHLSVYWLEIWFYCGLKLTVACSRAIQLQHWILQFSVQKCNILQLLSVTKLNLDIKRNAFMINVFEVIKSKLTSMKKSNFNGNIRLETSSTVKGYCECTTISKIHFI